MREAEYNHKFVEDYWQKKWRKSGLFHVEIEHNKPKYYVLDMFPYPSGAGLHVGHPLGYIASDIVTRYKRANGFNVLHPMGYDAFGLPAEQYAIQTGQHPAKTTEENIARYREQLDRIGFAFDWDREVRTCDPDYYKWTQWIFAQLFQHWYNTRSNKAEHIDNLIAIFENEGNVNVEHHGGEVHSFTAEEWLYYDAKFKEDILQKYRLAFLDETSVNWCEALGTVLANEEVKDGLSERGGHPVVKKTMKQWFLRITAYADRLIQGLETIDWTDSLKEIQKNWIGKSEGASIHFQIASDPSRSLEVFSTRPDTIYGATFMVIAPEHEWVEDLTSDKQKKKVDEYIAWALNRSERDRMSEVKKVSGVFTGSYCKHPFTNEEIPIYIADYVLGGYGTGAVMAVPAHDSRDHAFAKHFDLPIIQVIDAENAIDVQEESFDSKEGTCINSPLIDGLHVKEGISTIIAELERRSIGRGEINYKLRDAGFGRQRYWGEPFPIVYKNDIPQLVSENDLPVELPEVSSYQPTGGGASPLDNAEDWVNSPEGIRETDTMPGWAGSSWYFLRYMDPENENVLASADALNYWNQVDLYIGGSEHATGHLLYSRFWTKFLFDIGLIKFDEPFKKLVNQGMIQGVIESIYLQKKQEKERHVFCSADLVDDESKFTKLTVLIDFVSNYGSPDSYLNAEGILKFLNWSSGYEDAIFKTSEGVFDMDNLGDSGDEIHLVTKSETGKMSKRWGNVVNPDEVCDDYGADTLRLYEMFLGPLEDSKPWSTQGIDGVYRFLKKCWKLYIDRDGLLKLNDEKASARSLKALHTAIKKVTGDIERYSFNTVVSTYMICVNELIDDKCSSREVLEPLLILLAPYAPHFAEELWSRLDKDHAVMDASWPKFNEEYLVESTKKYPVSINGKTRTYMELPLDMSKEAIEAEVLKESVVLKWLDGGQPKKVIIVPGRIINVVI